MSLGELSGLPSNLSDDRRDRAVVLGARHAPLAVLAAQQATLPVARVAVGEARRLAEHGDGAGLLVPAHDAVVRDVAPQQRAHVAEPHRAFGPAHAGRELLDLGEAEAVAREALVEDLDVRIGIARARLKLRQRRPGGGDGCCGGACNQKRASVETHDFLPVSRREMPICLSDMTLWLSDKVGQCRTRVGHRLFLQYPGVAPTSAAGSALGVDVERIHRRAGRHEQAVAVRRRRSRHWRSVRAAAMRPISLPAGLKTNTPSRSALPMPQPHHRLPSTSQRNPSGVPGPGVDQHAPVRQPLAAADDVIGEDVARRAAGFDDVQLRLRRARRRGRWDR